MYAAAKQTGEGCSNGMETSTTGLGKRARTTDGSGGMGTEVAGNNEKRPGSAALEIALAVGLEVAKEHAQWWDPDLNPQDEAHQSSVVESADGAAQAWFADECNG